MHVENACLRLDLLSTLFDHASDTILAENVFKVDFQMFTRIALAIGYFVDKHNMKRLYM